VLFLAHALPVALRGRPAGLAHLCPRALHSPQAKELAEKKAQKLQEMDDNLKAKMAAAEERRQKLITGLHRARTAAIRAVLRLGGKRTEHACFLSVQKPRKKRPSLPRRHEWRSRARSPPPASKRTRCAASPLVQPGLFCNILEHRTSLLGSPFVVVGP